jgi:hypothetical protein
VLKKYWLRSVVVVNKSYDSDVNQEEDLDSKLDDIEDAGGEEVDPVHDQDARVEQQASQQQHQGWWSLNPDFDFNAIITADDYDQDDGTSLVIPENVRPAVETAEESILDLAALVGDYCVNPTGAHRRLVIPRPWFSSLSRYTNLISDE